jgi:hypothetical protein
VVLVAIVAAVLTLPLMVLTALGARRRGLVVPIAVLAGVAFPVTWALWYVRDEHPYQKAQRSQV